MDDRESPKRERPRTKLGGHLSDVPPRWPEAPLDWGNLDRTAIAYHLTMRLIDGRAIARSAADLRRASRLLHAAGEARGLLAFRVADSHAHVLLAASRETAGAYARYAASALRQALRVPVPFERARFRSVAEPRHLFNAVRYVFRQEEHHGTCFDPAHDGSSLPDLLGLRCIGAHDALR